MKKQYEEQKMFCNKSILVRGNLASDTLSYKLTRPDEFAHGIWHISILSAACESNIGLNFIAFVTCNVVTSQRLNENFEVTDYNQPLACFSVDINPPRYSKKHTRFYPMWFPINAPSQELIFTVMDLSTNMPVITNCEVVLNVLFAKTF